MCHESRCDSCDEFNFLNSCGTLVCAQCVIPCDECNKKFDVESELVDFCEQCDRTFCGDCATIVHCPRCDFACCADCLPKGRVVPMATRDLPRRQRRHTKRT